MAFTLELGYVRFDFAWQEAPEIQATGFYVAKTTTGDWDAPGPLTAAQDLAVAARDSWKSNIHPDHFAAAVTATQVTAYTLQSDGIHVRGKGVAGFTGSDTWEGTGSIPLPPENSIVLSLYATDPAAFQGPHPGRNRGRMYLPTPGVSVLTSAGRVASAAVTDLLNDFQALFQDVPTWAINGTDRVGPVIRSLADEAVPRITWLRMGSVVDTQRRRRNKLPEDYVNISL